MSGLERRLARLEWAGLRPADIRPKPPWTPEDEAEFNRLLAEGIEERYSGDAAAYLKLLHAAFGPFMGWDPRA